MLRSRHYKVLNFDGFETIDNLSCPRVSEKIGGSPVRFRCGLRCRILAAVTKGFLVRVRIYLQRCSVWDVSRFAPCPLTVTDDVPDRPNVQK